MDNKEILNFCMGKGILIDNEVLNLFTENFDIDSVKLILGKVIEGTSQKIITKKVFQENTETVKTIFHDLPEKNKGNFEDLTIKLGLSLEISAKKKKELQKEQENFGAQVKIFPIESIQHQYNGVLVIVRYQ